MKKKILIVSENFYPEEFKINDVALEWVKKGYDVDVLTQVPTYPLGKVFENYENKWFNIEKYEGITIYRVKGITGYKSSLFKKLLKYFTFMTIASWFAIRLGEKYDFILGFNVGALTSMLPAVLIKRIYKIPLIFWTLDIWPDGVYSYGFKKRYLTDKILKAFVTFMYNNIDALAVSSQGFIGKLKPYIKKNIKIIYLPNWADILDNSLETFSFSEDKKIQFTFAGNIGKAQNLEKVIIGFSKLKDEYLEQSQLNIIGNGSQYSYLKKLILERKYKNIILHGKKPREEISKYYKGSDFLIVSMTDTTSHALVIPAKVQTYLAAEKPIISIVNGATSDFIKKYNLGLIANPEKINEITLVFEQSICLSDKEKKVFTHNCYQLTNTLFNKQIIIDSLLKLLLEVVNKPS